MFYSTTPWQKLALSAQSRLAHSRLPTLNIIHHRATVTVTVTVMATIIGHGMGARDVGLYRVETARPTEVRRVEAGTPRMDAHPVTRYKAETAHPTGVTEFRPLLLRTRPDRLTDGRYIGAPFLLSDYGFCKSSGSFAIFTAIRAPRRTPHV